MSENIKKEKDPQDKFFKEIQNNLRGIMVLSMGSLLGLSFLVASLFAAKNQGTYHPELQTQNVIGGEQPEKFYEIKGNRVYLEIDGKPVEEYFPIKDSQ